MVLYLLLCCWLIWVSWWYFYGYETSGIIWLSALCYWINQVDSLWSSTLVVGLVFVYSLVPSKWSKGWINWSEINHSFVLTLMLIVSTCILWTQDSVLLLISIDILHLLMGVLVLNGRTLSRVLIFISTSWFLTVLILLVAGLNLCYTGELDFWSTLSNGQHSQISAVSYLLILGKVYVLPWVLICAVLYSGIHLNAVLLMSLSFGLIYSLALLGNILDISSAHLGWTLIAITVVSMVFSAVALLQSTLLNEFLGYSFSITVHNLVLLTLLSGSFSYYIAIFVLIIYLPLVIMLIATIDSLTSTLPSLLTVTGLSGTHNSRAMVLLLALLAFLGLPPAAVFFLKISVGMQYFYMSAFWFAILFVVSILVAYAYIRIALSLTSGTKSHSDIVADSRVLSGDYTITAGSFGLLLVLLTIS